MAMEYLLIMYYKLELNKIIKQIAINRVSFLYIYRAFGHLS